MYFYELHEGDGDLFHDLLLAHDEEIDPESFFAIVQEIRERVVNDFEKDTLIEAIAEEMERDHGFEVVWDTRLTASVNVSRIDEDNFLADVDPGDDDRDGNADDDQDEDEDDGRATRADFRTLFATLRPDDD